MSASQLPSTLPPLAHVAAVCVGASAGALARWALAAAFNTPSAVLPWGTLAANVVGGALIGLVLALLAQWPQVDPVWRLLIVTGFLGALTTFSTFSAEVLTLMQSARWAWAALLAGLHLGLSLLSAAGGWWAGQRIATFFVAT
jgi:fluoride exporter